MMDDVRRSKLDYSMIFGGFGNLDAAVPFEELVAKPGSPMEHRQDPNPAAGLMQSAVTLSEWKGIPTTPLYEQQVLVFGSQWLTCFSLISLFNRERYSILLVFSLMVVNMWSLYTTALQKIRKGGRENTWFGFYSSASGISQLHP